MGGRWPSNFVLIHNPGCEKIGTKRVDAGHWSQPTRGTYGNSNLAQQGAEYVLKETGRKVGYADSDGLETIDDWRCTENCPARRLGEQSGRRKSGALTRSETARAEAGKHGIYGQYKGRPDGKHFPASEGTAARFYFQADWSYERIEEEELWRNGR